MQNVDFNNPANYKNCSKKLYDIHVCMPPKNSVVINSLEQADVVKMLNGKTYFTAEEREKMLHNGDNRSNLVTLAIQSGRAYVVSDKTPFVLCGTSGELWTISPDKLAQTYTFLQNNQPYPINQQSLSQRVRKDGLLDWTAVRVSQQAIRGQNMACFVPSSQKGQIQTSWGAVLNINGVGVSHGKGDFIVCTKLPNGKPNLADRWVVNGEIFAATYNNQGWTDCLSSSSVRSITIDSLPKLVPQQAVNNDKGIDVNVFKQKCDTLMKELQKVYKFSVKSNTYETVKDYTGIAEEVEFDGDCYVAKYIVGGNFSHTYSVKDKATGNMTEKTVTATETDVWFGYSAVHDDSAIFMTIKPNIKDDLFLGGWVFPDSSTGSLDSYWSCKVGTIKDINCAEEVKLFKEKCGNRDVFIDNRKSNGNDPITDLYNAVISKSSTIINGLNEKKKYFIVDVDNDGKFLDIGKNFRIRYKDRGYISSGRLIVETPVNKDKMVSYILDFIGMFYKGMFSCFSAPKMNSTQLKAFKTYSGSGYSSLNSGLYNNNLSFDDYILYYELHEFLKKCRINRHMHLFRGVCDISVDTGDVISCNNFSSVSFDLGIAYNFSDSTIFRITDVYGLNGFFINSISEYRNIELEVLLDAGYDIHVDDLAYKYRGYKVYNCHIVRNNSESNFSISNYESRMELFLYSLYMEIMSNEKIASKGIVESCPSGSYSIRISFNSTEKNSIKRVEIKYDGDSDKIHISEDRIGSYDSKLVNTFEASESKFPDIIKYLEDVCSKVLCPIGSENMLVYTQVAQEFTDNGFLVIDDEVCDKYFKLILSGDNDDNVAIRFKIMSNENEYTVRVSAKSNGVSLDKTKSFTDLDSLSEGVYTLVASSFNLNSANRSDKVIGIISRYLKVNQTKVAESSSLVRYKLGDKEVIARLEGNGIIYSYNGNQVYTNHFDHITKVASNVYNTILSN